MNWLDLGHTLKGQRKIDETTLELVLERTPCERWQYSVVVYRPGLDPLLTHCQWADGIGAAKREAEQLAQAVAVQWLGLRW